MSIDRRNVLKLVSAAGIGSGVFARALAALADDAAPITPEMVQNAEWIAGLTLTPAQRDLMLKGLAEDAKAKAALRAIRLDNGVAPALIFQTAAGDAPAKIVRLGTHAPLDKVGARPASDDDLAFAPLTTLAALLKQRRVSSVELTRLYLARLEKYDPLLHCVITLTRDRALAQAAAADRELAAGRWRGPLHGVPYGAKDLLAVPGYPTTWGAGPYKTQVRPETATAVERVEAAGAVLVAKTTLGELAMGDVWYGEMTRNPWNPAQGSSGSSAGSASATAAGLVGFALGSETWGSIVSPCTRCGATGLRPTFGRVSRHGAMALSWSMDKLGPIARSADDLALVFDALHGADGRDRAAVDRPFAWPPARAPKTLTIGVVEELFAADYTQWAEKDEEKPGLAEWMKFDHETLETLRRLGFRLVPLQLPKDPPIPPLASILTAEAAAAFDELTRSGRDAELKEQKADSWPTTFRQAQFFPAVEYIRANRARTLLMQNMERALAGVDLYVAPSFGGDNLLSNNLTGHPCVVLPNGFRKDGTPTSITFVGKLFGETEILSVAREYQRVTDFHRRRPALGA